MPRAPIDRKLYYFDRLSADRAVKFFSNFLVHVKGEWAGQPFHLVKFQQAKIIRPLFGWKRRADGMRKYRKVYVEIPRKNGKSLLAAGVGLYCTFADKEPGAEVYSAATSRDQAGMVFEPAKAMVEANPELLERCEDERVYKRSIVVPAWGNFYQVLSADVPTKHGLNAHCVIVDELHAHKDRDFVDVLRTSMGSRRQPIFFMITTAGWDRHTICWEEHQYAAGTLDGTIDDPTYLAVIYGTAEGSDWDNPRAWARANPNLDVSLKRDYLEAEAKRARESPAYVNTFRRLHLDQWTEAAERWLDLKKWQRCGAAPDLEALVQRRCWGGLDLSSTLDLSAFLLVFPPADWPDVEDDQDIWDVLCWFWCPEANMHERVRRDHVPYDLWRDAGHIEATSGNVIDYDVIKDRILEASEQYAIQEIAVDSWNSAHIITQLGGAGITMVKMRQGFQSLSAPSKELEKRVISNKLRHGGHPVLSWCARNVCISEDAAGNIKPDKKRSHERIDGITSLVEAISRLIVDDTKTGSPYDKRGVQYI